MTNEMDDEDRTPTPEGYDEALWRKADETHHAMALVADDSECVKIIYAAISPAPAVVKALEWVNVAVDGGFPRLQAETQFGKRYEVFVAWWGDQGIWGYVCTYSNDQFFHTADEAQAAAQADYEQRIRSALATPDDGWLPIESAPKDGTPVDLWAVRGECGLSGYRDGRRYTNCVFARPTFGTEPYGDPRWLGLDDQYIKVTTTHWRPLPAPPANGRGE